MLIKDVEEGRYDNGSPCFRCRLDKSYIFSTAGILKSQRFENGVHEIQTIQTHLMNEEEGEACAHLRVTSLE